MHRGHTHKTETMKSILWPACCEEDTAQKILYSVPKKAGTIDSQREKENRSGVRRCCIVVGGISGPEEGMIRAVGSCRNCGRMIGIATLESIRTRTGRSSLSVSVSPAPRNPGAVVIVFGSQILVTVNLDRKHVLLDVRE